MLQICATDSKRLCQCSHCLHIFLHIISLLLQKYANILQAQDFCMPHICGTSLSIPDSIETWLRGLISNLQSQDREHFKGGGNCKDSQSVCDCEHTFQRLYCKFCQKKFLITFRQLFGSAYHYALPLYIRHEHRLDCQSKFYFFSLLLPVSSICPHQTQNQLHKN